MIPSTAPNNIARGPRAVARQFQMENQLDSGKWPASEGSVWRLLAGLPLYVTTPVDGPGDAARFGSAFRTPRVLQHVPL